MNTLGYTYFSRSNLLSSRSHILRPGVLFALNESFLCNHPQHYIISHMYWMFKGTLLEVWQPRTFTCLAIYSSVTRDACTCVRIDIISTSSSIHTWDAVAFVDVYKNNTHLTDHQLLLNESKTEAIAFNVPSCKVTPAMTDNNMCVDVI